MSQPGAWQPGPNGPQPYGPPRLDLSVLDSFGKYGDEDDVPDVDEGPVGNVLCPQTFVDGGSPQGALHVTEKMPEFAKGAQALAEGG